MKLCKSLVKRDTVDETSTPAEMATNVWMAERATCTIEKVQPPTRPTRRRKQAEGVAKTAERVHALEKSKTGQRLRFSILITYWTAGARFVCPRARR